MKQRDLGNTGIRVSEIGFGCGSVGGLMIRGDREDMTRAVAYAIEHGITYFDTARSYGDGQSETNLGAVLRELNADVVVGTKVTLREPDLVDIGGAIRAQVDEGLGRLGRDSVDVILLHNRMVDAGGDGGLVLDQVEAAADALRAAVADGKTKTWGLNGLGDTSAVHAALNATRPGVIQTVYNALNPSSGDPEATGYVGQDFEGLAVNARAAGTGPVGIRVLAAGALSGGTGRHPIAAPKVGPIGTGSSYEDDVRRAQAFGWVVEEGVCVDLVELAIRFAISNDHLSTALVGLASFDQLEHAIRSAEKGPLPEDVLARIAESSANA